MFEFLTKEQIPEYDAFIWNHPNQNFLQASVWGELKSEWEKHFLVSRDDEGKIRAAMMILVRRVPHLPYTILYAARGPVCDSDCKDAMIDLAQGVKALAKEKKGYIFRADPGMRMSDEVFKDSVTQAGFKIKPAGKNFEGIQPRFVYRLPIEGKTEDEILNNFESKTRYNLRLSVRKGVTVRLGKREELPRFFEIMKETGARDNFSIRPLSYFEKMYDLMHPENLRFYVAEHEGDIIAGTIAIYYGDKVWYLYGASSNSKRNVMPNYLLQWEMIKWAKEKDCRIYDFRGVSGDLTPENPLYGLYRFKKGFNGELVEFVGEIEMVFKPFVKKIIDLGQKVLKR